MSTSIYVGGLSYDATEDFIRSTFEEFGEIEKVKIIQTHDGQPRGFGFVTFATSEAANGAIDGMNGKIVAGRSLKVNEVRNRGGRESSYSYRDRDRSYRRDREDRFRDRYRSRRYSPKRRRRDRSPFYRRDRSPDDDRSRSASPSPSPVSSYDRYDCTKAERTKTSKENNIDNAKLKDELAKAVELQRSRREEVTVLQADLHRANKANEEIQNKYKGLEQSLASVTALFNSHIECLRQMKRAFFDVKDCKERLRGAELDLEIAFADATFEVASLDPPLPHSNGDIKYIEGPKPL